MSRFIRTEAGLFLNLDHILFVQFQDRNDKGLIAYVTFPNHFDASPLTITGKPAWEIFHIIDGQTLKDKD